LFKQLPEVHPQKNGCLVKDDMVIQGDLRIGIWAGFLIKNGLEYIEKCILSFIIISISS
jgi:hypothetical protein